MTRIMAGIPIDSFSDLNEHVAYIEKEYLDNLYPGQTTALLPDFYREIEPGGKRLWVVTVAYATGGKKRKLTMSRNRSLHIAAGQAFREAERLLRVDRNLKESKGRKRD